MLWGIKRLSPEEYDICHKTLSPKAAFAIVGDAIVARKGLSIVRMGDGEVKILNADTSARFADFDDRYPDFNARLGIEDLPTETLREYIVSAANACTYFAPSVSGISLSRYKLHDLFQPRSVYFDNFFVNDWSKRMIGLLLEASDGAFIIHRDYAQLIENFVEHYELPRNHFAGFAKESWRDNEEAVQAALKSGKQLALFSAGPAGKIIGPAIAAHGMVAIDVGNTLPGWSMGKPNGD